MNNIITFTLLLLIAKFYTCNCATNATRVCILEHIIDEIKKYDLKSLGNQTVNFTKKGEKTCVEEFFCCAEKCLKNLHSKNVLINKISRSLEKYNKFRPGVSCSSTLIETKLKTLMEDIQNCAQHERDVSMTCGTVHVNKRE
ncbi:hypothetical protein PAMP_015838 [Pampus punctatissimus]